MGLLAGTVYDRPPRCERCDRLETECKCPPLAPPSTLIPPKQQTARLSTEKRKKGKLVTVVRGLSAAGNDLPALLTKLKTSIGAGGTIEGEELEIQGTHLERVRQLLEEIGYKVKG
ncbi:MAG: translation initiation factor [Planctomycetaceae bacterium]|nr:translation initiation factor [Planctomycetaceae bacterium]